MLAAAIPIAEQIVTFLLGNLLMKQGAKYLAPGAGRLAGQAVQKMAGGPLGGMLSGGYKAAQSAPLLGKMLPATGTAAATRALGGLGGAANMMAGFGLADYAVGTAHDLLTDDQKEKMELQRVSQETAIKVALEQYMKGGLV